MTTVYRMTLRTLLGMQLIHITITHLVCGIRPIWGNEVDNGRNAPFTNLEQQNLHRGNKGRVNALDIYFLK